MPLTPEQRKMRAQIAANERWANTPDRSAAMKKATTAARDTLRARFAAEIDPDGVLDPVTLERCVDSKVRAHMQRLALASSVSRSKKAAG